MRSSTVFETQDAWLSTRASAIGRPRRSGSLSRSSCRRAKQALRPRDDDGGSYRGRELFARPLCLVPAHALDPPSFVVHDVRVGDDVVSDAVDDLLESAVSLVVSG
jgi:hypothetical protein